MGLDTEELGIIKTVVVGCMDTMQPSLWLTIRTLRGEFLHRIVWEHAGPLLANHAVGDVNHLVGRECVVTTDGSAAQFERLL